MIALLLALCVLAGLLISWPVLRLLRPGYQAKRGLAVARRRAYRL